MNFALVLLWLLDRKRPRRKRKLHEAVVRSVTGFSGAVTNYGANGRVITRETTSSNGTTTIYDAGGHTVGRFTRGR
jgi:YD repeat-containing protein